MSSLPLLDKNKNFHSDITAIFLDKSIPNRYKTIMAYCESTKKNIDPAELKHFTHKLEKTIYNQVFYYAHLMYHYMTISNDWGEPGEQQVKITFCRNLLKIDPNIHLDESHAKTFELMVTENIKRLKINDYSAEHSRQQLRNFKFNLFGQMFEIYKANNINTFLKFAGSNKFLHAGQYGSQMELIFGSGTSKDYREYTVTHVKKEYIRTPNNVVSMAAIIGHNNIYIRLESLKTIFAQKWLQIFNYSEVDMISIYSDPFWNIAEGIKQKVLEIYNINTREDLIENEQKFIKDMSETIFHHELGHGIVSQNILSHEFSAIGEASKFFGENIYTAILEFLADFSPSINGIHGPIQNMIEISKKNRSRAVKMYLMYMSDTWFYNTNDTYMYTYSDLITLILIRYLTPNDVDFDTMEKELLYPSETSHFNRILTLYNNDILELKTICENATFDISGNTMNFTKIRSYLIEQFRKNDGFVHVETYEFLVPFWSNIFGYIQSISNSKTIVSDFLKQQEAKTLKKVMILSAGKEKSEDYKYDHRAYIVDTLLRLKIVGIDAS
jgi:hypothetical protein